MKSKQVRNMVTTAVLLALTIVFQNIRMIIGVNPVSTYITSVLVNTGLIVATMAVSVYAGLAIAAVAPLIALLQQFAQAPMVPWIMGGNALLVLVYALAAKKEPRSFARFAVSGVIAATLKFVLMLLGNAVVLSGKGQAFQAALWAAAGLQVQQVITAVIAIFVSGAVLKPVEKVIKRGL